MASRPSCPPLGLRAQDGAAPTLIENEVYKNWVGVEVIEHAEPTLRGNKIHHCRLNGIQVYKEAKGLYEGNDISACTHACVRVWELGDPTMNGNTIRGGKACGILIYECGKGHFVDNDIADHREWGIEVKRFATPLFEKNRLSGSHMGGVYCHGGGGIGAFTSDFTNRDSAITRFTFTDNDVFGNRGVGVSVGNDGVPVITHNRIYGGQNAGVYVAGTKAQGTITDNEIYENKDGIVLREGACPHIERNDIHDQKRRGVVVCARGQGMLVDNRIAGSGWYNIEVRGEKPKMLSPEKAEKELEKKKRLYASAGLLVAMPKDGVTISGLITDESGRTSIALRKNVITGGGRGGVLMQDWATGFMKENEVSENSGSGLIVGVGADPEINGNVLRENAEHGVHVRAGGRGRYSANKVHDNGSSGLCLEADSSSDVRANELYRNDGPGALLMAGANARLSANEIHGNGGAGVEVDGEGSTQLRDNDLHSNKGGGGVLVRGATAVVIINNTVRENEHAGLLLVEGANPVLAKNRFTDNGAEGVRCESGAKGRFERNTIQSNGGVAVFAEVGCSPTVDDNNFIHHNEGGNDPNELGAPDGDVSAALS